MKKLERAIERLVRRRGLAELGNSFGVRFAARSGGVLVLAGALFLGLVDGGHLDGNAGARKFGGKLASLIGYAADDIRITGLVRQETESLLATIGVQPGGSLIGFDAVQARKLLENVDWVASAKVMRRFPNQLDIEVVERDPFAVWQRDGKYYVIDRSGAAISTLAPSLHADLLLVTGEGAQTAAAELVSMLDEFPTLRPRVKAASRAGQRRWNVMLDNGVVLELPEKEPRAALEEVVRLDAMHGLLAKGIRRIDSRVAGQTAITIVEVDGGKAPSKTKETQ
jgi:cell division protein FtsQ